MNFFGIEASDVTIDLLEGVRHSIVTAIQSLGSECQSCNYPKLHSGLRAPLDCAPSLQHTTSRAIVCKYLLCVCIRRVKIPISLPTPSIYLTILTPYLASEKQKFCLSFSCHRGHKSCLRFVFWLPVRDIFAKITRRRVYLDPIEDLEPSERTMPRVDGKELS